MHDNIYVEKEKALSMWLVTNSTKSIFSYKFMLDLNIDTGI
jgi:hypothetical protein